MSTPVMDDEDELPKKPHPENLGGDKPPAESARTKRHDWLDEKFDDEIDLERAMGDAPPRRLVRQAMTRGAVSTEAEDAAWFFLGKFKTSAQRPSTRDSRWTMSCRRCPKGARKLKTTRVVVEAQAPQEVEWLRRRKVLTEQTAQHVYRVGRCVTCRGIFWFELLVAVPK